VELGSKVASVKHVGDGGNINRGVGGKIGNRSVSSRNTGERAGVRGKFLMIFHKGKGKEALPFWEIIKHECEPPKGGARNRVGWAAVRKTDGWG